MKVYSRQDPSVSLSCRQLQFPAKIYISVIVSSLKVVYGCDWSGNELNKVESSLLFVIAWLVRSQAFASRTLAYSRLVTICSDKRKGINCPIVLRQSNKNSGSWRWNGSQTGGGGVWIVGPNGSAGSKWGVYIILPATFWSTGFRTHLLTIHFFANRAIRKHHEDQYVWSSGWRLSSFLSSSL